MSVKYISGDLFHHSLDAIAHGCNCEGAMGKGIALEFRSRYPEMYQEYRRRCKAREFKLGSVFAWRSPEGTIIFNLGTQVSWRTKARLDAIRASVRRMVGASEQINLKTIGLPRIGAGLGGLDWDKVKEVLDGIGSKTDIDLIVFEEYIKGR